jgi:hypothetical protein
LCTIGFWWPERREIQAQRPGALDRRGVGINGAVIGTVTRGVD